jgi:hypothetical protein
VSWLFAAQTVIPALGAIGGGYGVAALVTHKAAKVEAEAADKQATTADWKAYVDSVHVWNGGLADRLEHVETRLDEAEQRSHFAEERAVRAETLYHSAIAYVKQIADWVAERLPGHAMPPPPPELEADL